MNREITGRFAVKDAGGAKPFLEVGGWNVDSNFTCAALTVSPKEIKAGEPLTVTASIARTFLDGTRVALRVDGQPAATQWAWARGKQKQNLEFPLTVGQPGKHEVRVGNQRLELTVQP